MRISKYLAAFAVALAGVLFTGAMAEAAPKTWTNTTGATNYGQSQQVEKQAAKDARKADKQLAKDARKTLKLEQKAARKSGSTPTGSTPTDGTPTDGTVEPLP
jgi:uncharacterized protein YycO